MMVSGWRKTCPATLAVVAVLWLPTSVRSQQPQAPGVLTASAIQQIAALQSAKARRTPAQRKIASRLLHTASLRRGEPVLVGGSIRASVTLDRDGRADVDLRANVTAGVLAAVTAAGGTIVTAVPAYRAVRASIPVTQIETIASLPDVVSITPADQMIVQGVQSRRVPNRPITNKEMP